MKYKILICEDEQIELSYLEEVIKKHLGEKSDVVSVDNGDAALDAIVDFYPDLVLMDIHLGNWNGLDLSKIILEEHPNTRIIVITAYDQFNYAQQAIQTGIVDYLLKPIPADKLIENIDKQIQIIEGRQDAILAQTKIKRNIDKLNEMFSRTFMNDIINNQLLETHVRILGDKYTHDYKALIFIIKCTLDSIELNDNENFILKKIIVDQLRQCNQSIPIFYDILHSDSIILCWFEPKASSKSNTQIANEIRSMVFSSLHIPVKLGVSEPTEEILNLHTAYKQALHALQIGEGIINNYKDYERTLDMPDQIAFSNRIPEIISCVLSCEEKELDKLILDLQNQFEISALNLADKKAYFISIWVELIKEIGTKITSGTIEIGNKITDPVLQFINAQGLSELIEILSANLHSMIATIKDRMVLTHNYIASRAKEYINEHYTESINLSTIAKALKVSSYYLSHLFKIEYDKNITEYITEQRIQKSCELLKNTDDTLNDIAQKTGFNDTNYFCRVFKRKTSITPTQYRNLNKQQNALF